MAVVVLCAQHAHAAPEPPRWADVRKDGADAFDSVDDIKTGAIAKHVDDRTYVAVKARARPVRLDGKTYVRTDQGWIATTDLSWYSPSPFAGIDVTPQTSFDIGWTVAKK